MCSLTDITVRQTPETCHVAAENCFGFCSKSAQSCRHSCRHSTLAPGAAGEAKTEKKHCQLSRTSRHIWNKYFMKSGHSTMRWLYQYVFANISDPWFKAIFLAWAKLNPRDSYSDILILEYLTVSSCISLEMEDSIQTWKKIENS